MNSTAVIKEVLDSYRNWILKNPDKASDFETAFKWISYFVAGRINNTQILTELVYSASNLLVFFNDRLVAVPKGGDCSQAEKIRVWLTVLEYSEVFIEISAFKFWGTKGKWLIIAALQVIKCATRLILLLKHNEQLVPCPAISPLKRPVTEASLKAGPAPTVTSVGFTLKRSGRVIRKVESTPSGGYRLWRPPAADHANFDEDDDSDFNKQILRRQLFAEVAYIVKPMFHLALSYKFGPTSWKPWMLSLAMDLGSLYVLKFHRKQPLTEQERLELSRRSLLLLLYLLRSPFFEQHSEDRLNHFLDVLARTVPLARFICSPIKQYIPYWQSTYSYAWST